MAGDIKLSSNFELSAQKPVDEKTNVATLADRDAIPLIKRYDRMIVAVQGGYTYQLTLGAADGDLANNANWLKFGAASWDDIEGVPATFTPAPHEHYRILNNSNADVSFNIAGTSTSSTYYPIDNKVTIQFDAPETHYVNIIQTVNDGFSALSIYENGVLIYDNANIFDEYIDFNAGTDYGIRLGKSLLFIAGNTYQFEFITRASSFVAYDTVKSTWYEDGFSYPFVPNYSLYFTDDTGAPQDLTDKVLFQCLRYDKYASVVTENGTVTVTAEETTIFGNTVLENDLIVKGNIIQQGTAYETHAEQLYSTKDMLLMRDGAVAGLQANELSGFRIFNYDGTNNLFFGADASGIVRVGDENGTLQALATREDVPLNGGFAKWNAAAMRFETVDLSLSYSVANHTHDDRYYTESEINTKLAEKADTDHTHDDRYYTESEINTKLAEKADTTHNHDSAYLGITAKAADSGKLNGYTQMVGTTGSTIALRDVLGDMYARLFRSTYGEQTNAPATTADICFRNSTSDNYIRFMSNSAFSTWCQNALIKTYNSDRVDGYHATTALTANNIPVRDANGYLTSEWLKLYEGTSWRGTVGYDANVNAVMLWNGGATADSGLYIYDSDGHAEFTSVLKATDFQQSSDRRLKKKIKPLKKGIDGLKPVSFKWKNKKIKGTQYGFIAQDMQKTHPELVSKDEKGMLGIKQNSIIALLAKEVQELKKQLTKLTTNYQ